MPHNHFNITFPCLEKEQNFKTFLNKESSIVKNPNCYKSEEKPQSLMKRDSPGTMKISHG